jgi:hypothetical protein
MSFTYISYILFGIDRGRLFATARTGADANTHDIYPLELVDERRELGRAEVEARPPPNAFSE